MNSFELRVPKKDLDLPMCVSCGQVFRWQELPNGDWAGVDGHNFFVVSLNDSCEHTDYKILSNAHRPDFERLFRLDVNQTELEQQIVERGPELSPYVDQLSGLRLMRPSCPVEEMFCFLCTSNNHLSRIVTMVRSLGSYGECIASQVNGWTPTLFPTPEVIASIPEEELRNKGFGYRARTIPMAAKQLAERGGEGFLRELANKPYEYAHTELCKFSGVGPKLADCIALFALGHTSAVPVDTHLWQAAIRLYFPQWIGSSLTPNKMKIIGDHFRERFGELAGWAHQYLFYDNLLNWRARKAPPVSV